MRVRELSYNHVALLAEVLCYDGAGALAHRVLGAWLEDTVDVYVQLLVVEGDAALDLCALELRGAVPPDDVFQSFTSR